MARPQGAGVVKIAVKGVDVQEATGEVKGVVPCTCGPCGLVRRIFVRRSDATGRAIDNLDSPRLLCRDRAREVSSLRRFWLCDSGRTQSPWIRRITKIHMKNIEHVNKAGAWHRLKREGRLEQFNARREQLRAELRAQGMKRKEASHEAWRLAIEEFPPLPVEASDVEDQGRDDDEQDNPLHWDYPAELMPPPRPYHGSDILWAYDRMVLKSTLESDAPSRGDWGLLQWGRQNPHAFYFQLLPKAFQSYEKRAHEEQPVKKSEHKTVEERLTMFTDFVEECEAEKKRLGIGDTEMLHAID